MNKIISYVAIVVLSVAGFSTAAKETSTTSQTTLESVEAKTTALVKVVEKTEEIKVSTLEKIEKQLSELDAQKNERTKIEIERDRKSIEFWFAALAILTAIGALFPFLIGRKDKELLKIELASIKNDKADIQRMKDDVQRLLSDTKTDSSAIKAVKEEVETARALLLKQQPGDKINAFEKEKIIQAADRVIKSSENPQDAKRAEAIKVSEQDDGDLALLLWQRFLRENPTDPQASFYVAYWMLQNQLKKSNSSVTDFAKINKAYAVAEKNDILENGKLSNRGIQNNWGVTLTEEARILAKTDINTAQELWDLARKKFALTLSLKPDDCDALSNWGVSLDYEACELSKNIPQKALKLWGQAREKYDLALAVDDEYHNAANNLGKNLLDESAAIGGSSTDGAHALLKNAKKLLEKHAQHVPAEMSYNLACVYARLDEVHTAIEQLEIARFNDQLPSHWREDDDLANLRKMDEYKIWHKTHFGDDKT